jgi:hypothetical protein
MIDCDIPHYTRSEQFERTMHLAQTITLLSIPHFLRRSFTYGRHDIQTREKKVRADRDNLRLGQTAERLQWDSDRRSKAAAKVRGKAMQEKIEGLAQCSFFKTENCGRGLLLGSHDGAGS